MPAPLMPLLWMLLAQLLFAGMNVFTRLGGHTLPWPQVAAARFLVGALVAYAVGRWRGVPLAVTDRPLAWRRSVFGTLAATATFSVLASDRIPLGDAATLLSLAPLFIAALSLPLLGERVGRHTIAAGVLALLGVALVVRPSFQSTVPLALIAILGAFCHGLAMIWLRRLGPGESGEAIVLHFSLLGLAVMTLLSMPTWITPSGTAWYWLAGTGLSAGIAQLAMTKAYSGARAAPLSVLTYLSVVFTHVVAIPIFQERPSLWQLAGTLLVIVGGALASSGRKAGAAQPA